MKTLCYDEYENITVDSSWERTIEWDIVQQYLFDISQPCHEMLRSCSFGHENIHCMSIFDTVLTDGGSEFIMHSQKSM